MAKLFKPKSWPPLWRPGPIRLIPELVFGSGRGSAGPLALLGIIARMPAYNDLAKSFFF